MIPKTPKFLISAAAALLLCGAAAMPAVSAPAMSGGKMTTTTPASGTKAIHANKTGDVDGTAWLNSSNESKLSFLLGVENAIAMEYALAQTMAQQQGKTIALSPFQEGWMIAFQDTPRQQIVSRVDGYYKEHTDQRNRHVFDVIWTEMIMPVMPPKAPVSGK